MSKSVEIKLYGDLGNTIGKYWDLDVSSVAEAIHAINILSRKKLYKYFIEKDKENIRYKIIVNGDEFVPTTEIQNGNIEAIKYSELSIKRSINKIEIVPIIEGGDKGIITAVLGAVLVIVGIVLIATGYGAAIGVPLITGGIGLLAAGIMTMLSQPPEFEDFRSSNAPNGRNASYLFAGPVNTISEGGPVPLGYGRLLVGSQVISTSYDISEDFVRDVNGNKVFFIEKDNQATEGLSVLTTQMGPDTEYEMYGVTRSVTNIKILDLISEGPIEGLVTAYLDFSNKGTAGNVGYDSPPDVKFYKPGTSAQPDGRIGWLRSVYWNEVPVLNADGLLNFQSASVTQTNGYASGVERPDGTENLKVVRSIGERFRKEGGSRIYRIYNRNLTHIEVNLRIINLARITSNEKGTKYNATRFSWDFEYRIFSDDGVEHTWQEKTTDELYGFISKGYLHKKRFAIQKGPIGPKILGYEIRLTRNTVDPFVDQKGPWQSTIFVDSITEIYQDKFAYPNSAIITSSFNSEFFSSVPTRAFDCWLKKVKIPSNYNAQQRTYSEGSPWNGTFSSSLTYTNNPAWVYYDLITNKNYGLGKYISANQIDKWTLYEIAKYCDTLVSDGYGGLEPRFTCNLYLQTREDAYRVLNDLASVFNAITYYGAGLIYAVQDSEKDPIVSFTNANVENGDFTYSNSSKKFRHTVAMVRWNDPSNFFRPTVEFVEDLQNIRKYGIKQVDVTAFACTSRGQAIRLGRYILLSENLETETITFTAGLEAAYLRPGDIFKVFDRHKKSARFGGRTSKIEESGGSQLIYLDDDLSSLFQSGVSYRLSLLTPSWNFDPENHSSVMTQADIDNIRKSFIQNGNFVQGDTTVTTGVTKITFAAGTFDLTNYTVESPCVWTVELVTNPTTYENSIKFIDTNYDLFRVVKIDEKEGNKYEVFGLQYSSNKFSQIEDGLTFERPTNIFRAVPAKPAALSVSIQPQVA